MTPYALRRSASNVGMGLLQLVNSENTPCRSGRGGNQPASWGPAALHSTLQC